MSEDVKWYMHVLGPDDVIEQPDELTALREANRMNRFIAEKRNPDGNDPWGMAVAVTQADAFGKPF